MIFDFEIVWMSKFKSNLNKYHKVLNFVCGCVCLVLTKITVKLKLYQLAAAHKLVPQTARIPL